MYVSRESPTQTHRRLLRVIAAADLRVHDGAFAYDEHPVGRFPIERTQDALALVRDEDVWSVLAPASGTAAEPLRVISFHFRAGLDNGGFVGWLASHLKAHLGTGVVVVCGSNSERGGVFDYWGVPEALFEPAMAEIEQLRQVVPPMHAAPMHAVPTHAAAPTTASAIAPPFNLDGVVMQVTSTACNGVVDARTRIAFRQFGARVLGRYSGGDVRRGCLAGTVSGDRLAFRYVQCEGESAIHAGRSNCELSVQPDGRLRIREHFSWTTRPGSGTNVFEQVP